ncbi:MAG: DUF2971 domain-containing protein [Chryseobacterium sp.]|uniref:DUF2971 domain-containing protein n=1 Tax=Chryseobacterium sp. TaxID=1871047 RepID=UPI003D0DEB4C
MKLYKYRGDFQRDLLMLSESKLFASTYDNLNDPFEGMFDDQEDREIIDIFKPYSYDVEIAYEKVLEGLNKVGIYSLSKDYDNEILWALYANSHTGFVIEYELESLLEDFNFNTSIPLVHKLEVIYSELPLKTNTIFSSLKNQFELKELLGTKSKPWETENEFRLIFEMNGLIEFNPKAVTSIIFGLRSEQKHIDKTMELLKGRNIKYYKISKGADSYKLIKEEVEDKFKDFINLNRIVENWKSKIPEEFSKYKEMITKVLNHILNLPNVIDIYSIYINDDSIPIKLQIQAKTSFEMIPLRYFEYCLQENQFINTN